MRYKSSIRLAKKKIKKDLFSAPQKGGKWLFCVEKYSFSLSCSENWIFYTNFATFIAFYKK